MPDLTLSKAGSDPIDWNATGDGQVMQNVQNLFSTREYEVAYDRGMGINPAYIDSPSESSVGALTNELTELLSIYEPRAKLKSVNYTDGKYQVTVEAAYEQ